MRSQASSKLRTSQYASLTTLAFLIASTPVLAHAQAASSPPPAAPATGAPASPTVGADAPASPDANTGDAGEILVTARRVTERLIDSPTAVTALTSDQLLSRNIVGFRELNAFVPNFRWQTQGSQVSRIFNSFVVRGVSGDRPEISNVSVFLDGINVGGGASIPGLTDVTQVEVIKGPQSAYFGRSTFAGALNFITAAPSFDFHVKASTLFTTAGQQEHQASVEGAVIPGLLAMRVSGRLSQTPSYADNYGYSGRLGKQSTDSYSVGALLTPSSKLSLRLFHTGWRDNDGPNATYQLTSADWNCNGGRAPVTTFNYYCGDVSHLRSPTQISQNITVPQQYITQLTNLDALLGPKFIQDYGLKRRARFSSAILNWELPYGLTFSANGGIVSNRFALMQDAAQRYETTPGLYAINLTAWKVKNEVAEARLTSDQSKPIHAMIGYSYFNQQAGVNAFTFIIRPTSVNPTPSTNLYQTQNTHNNAVFGSVGVRLFGKLDLSAEGRYQWETISAKSLLTGLVIAGDTKTFTPKLIASYKINPNLNVYVSYARGTRGAQPNTNFYALPAYAQSQIVAQVGTVPTVVPEERVQQYEAGVKGDFFDRHLRLILAGYVGTYDHRQINNTFFYTNTQGNPAQAVILLSNGKTNLSGMEAEAHLRVDDHLSLDGTFGYAHTDVRADYASDALSITGNANQVGKLVPRYPQYTGSASVNYVHPAFRDFDGFARLDYIYQGRQYADAANLAWIKPSNVVNASIGISNHMWRFEIFGRNIFDNQVPAGVSRASDVYTGGNDIAMTPQEPAAAGFRVSLSY